MEEVFISPPRTIMEVYRMLPEGTLAELIDGIIYMSPSPLRAHQKVITKLTIQIGAFVERNNLGELYVAPFDVYLDEHLNAVQPDLVFVSKENISIIKGHIHGVPDLLIEILSPGNKSHDTKKKDLYERFGVKEYWIIDPETKEATGYTLEKGKFVERKTDSGKISSVLLKHDFEF